MKGIGIALTTFLLFVGLAALSFASQMSQVIPGVEQLPPHEDAIVSVLRSVCVFGLYIDDGGSQQGVWDTTIYMANLDSQTPRNFDVYISFVNPQGVPQVTPRSFVLRPNESRRLACEDLTSCNTQGWLQINSDSPLMGVTVLIEQPAIAGSVTAQPPTECVFALAP